MKKYLAYLGTGLAVPLISLAAIDNLQQAGNTVISIINDIIVPVVFAVAFIVFVWGAFNVFIIGANNEDAKEKGKNLMLYGLIGFFVMISVWGLVNILLGTFDLNNATPQLPQTGGSI